MPHKPQSHPRHTIALGVLTLMALLLLGTAGFMLAGANRSVGDALWITTNILTTVGAFKLSLTVHERIWASFLMLAGVLTVFYVGINLVAFVVDGELRALFGRRQLKKQIDQLRGHTVVCGFGRMGQALCELLSEKKKPFVVIENNPEKTALADKRGYLYIHGNAMDEQALAQARITEARGLSSCLKSDADNVFVTLTAREMSPKLTIIARSENMDSQSKLLRAGANRVICTPVHGANKIMQMLMHPAVAELVELAVSGEDLEVSKIQVQQLPKAHGHSLRELALPTKTGHIIIALVRPDGSRSFNPPADTVLTPADQIIVIGPAGGTHHMLKTLGNTSET